MSARHLYYTSAECIPADSEAADEVKALADAIEAKLSRLVEQLLEAGEHVAAAAILDRMITMTTELRALVANKGWKIDESE